MTARQYLKKIEIATRRIEAVCRRIEELEVRAQGVGAIRYDKDRVQTSPQDRMPDMVIKLAEMEDKYAAAVVREQRFKMDAQRRINRLPDARYITILTARYVDCLTWEETARLAGYGIRQSVRIHDEALKVFADQNRDVIGG